jgi:murein DD-endopeptidase MepM/ murein hydrolase activator NlpD
MRLHPLFFLFGSNRRLSNGSVRFVTRRTAWCMVFTTATLALAAGAALGLFLSTPNVVVSREAGNDVERSYMLNELGKLNASVARMNPRVTRLATQVAELSDFRTRMKAPPKPARHPSPSEIDQPALDGAGGPSLPPKRCGNFWRWPARTSVDGTQRQVDCLAKTLDDLEQEVIEHAAALAMLPGRPPVVGARFVSSFGNRHDPFNQRLRFHSGVDFAAQVGTPIYATAAGRVAFAGSKSGYGLTVEIDHGDGLMTRYGHASHLNVREGELVLPLQHIADIGSTGRSTGPHLHFEVLEKGEPINPLGYLSLFSESPDG